MTLLPNFRHLLTGLAVAACALAAGTVLADNDVRPLAIVDQDTLTTTDVRIELGLMKQRRTGDGPTMRPDAEQVLRRLIENRLVIQEGYRMGLQDEFVVANQVKEFVMTRAMGAHLDSVAATVPADTPDLHEARRLKVAAYMASLRDMYHVKADSALLASLDYGRDDDAYQQHLREDPSVLAVVPKGTLTVAGFSRILRFKEYHGLIGKPDADRRRDEVFRNWLAEAVLAHHLNQMGTLTRPPYTIMKTRLERDLVLQETLRVLLDFEFAPTEDEVESYYQDHLADYTPELQVKMETVKVASQPLAEALRQKVVDGTPLDWLRKNDPTVIPGPPPFPAEFFPPAKLNVDPASAEIGFVPAPYQVPSGWVVARIIDVQQPVPTPLAECRQEVLGGLKGQQTKELLVGMIAQLKSATPVEVMPDAEQLVAETIDEFIARIQAEAEAEAAAEAEANAGSTGPVASPSQEG